MNIVQLQEQLKNFSQDQLVREMQMPSGTAPQFLVLGEIMRRQKMQQDFSAQKAKGQSQSTVAEDAIAAAGVPQGGVASMARALAPQTDMDKSTGVVAMANGGPVKKMQTGGAALVDPAIRAMANRMGMSVEEYLRSVGEEQAARIEQSAAARALRERMAGMEPSEGLMSLPTQEDLDARYAEEQGREPIFPDSGFSQPAPAPLPMTYGRPLTETLAGRTGTVLPPETGNVREALRQFERNYTTTTEDFTRPLAEWWNRPDETVRSIDPYTGRFLDAPTVGTQLRQAGKGIAGLVSELPAFNMAAGNPYSELTEAEVQALASGEMSPEEADKLQAERIAKTAAAAATAADIGATELQNPAFRAAMAKRATPEVEAAQDREIERAAEQPTQPAADTTPSGGGTGAGGAGGGIASAGGMSSYEQELMDMLGRREKAAQQDKWLALAQVGLNMMSSTQPTLLGAIGEAGVKGVEAARSARDQYDKDRLELLGAIEQSRQSRAAAAARAARGASSGGIGGLKLKDYLGALKTSADVAADRLKMITGYMDPYMLIKQAQAANQLGRASEIQSALDAAIAAQNDYMGAVSYIGGAGPTPVEQDDTMIDLEGEQ